MKRLLAAYLFICCSLFAAWQASAQLVGEGLFKPPSAPVITPANIFGSNLVAWFSADQGVLNNIQTQTPATSGQGVMEWQDLTLNGNHMYQTTASNQPVFTTNAFNSKPGLTFTAANSSEMHTYLASNFSGLQAASVWLAGFYTSSCQAFCRFFSSSDNTGTQDFLQTDTIGNLQEDNLLQEFFPNAAATGGAAFNLSYNAKARLGLLLTSTAIVPYLNGASQGSTAATIGPFSSTLCMALGSSVNFNCNPTGAQLDGVIAEIFFANVAPSPAQVAQIDLYLKKHWGL